MSSTARHRKEIIVIQVYIRPCRNGKINKCILCIFFVKKFICNPVDICPVFTINLIEGPMHNHRAAI